MDEIIGILLRVGVTLSALIVLAGGVIYEYRHGSEVVSHRSFQGEPAAFRTLHGLASWSTLGSGRALIVVGLLVLVLTPVTRVAFSLVVFALERDWLYTGVTAVVLSLLLYGLLQS